MSEASIWAKLRAKGFSEKATAAIMGNMQGESGLIPYRVQGDFDWKSDLKPSKDYTAAVDSGRLTKNDFLFYGPGGGGYGLCQWTFWSRKEGLYDLAKSRGVSIGDEQVQIDWFYQEIQKAEYIYKKNNYEQYQVFKYLNMDGESLLDMTKAVMRGYEKPHDQSDAVAAQRAKWGQDIWDWNKGTTPDVDPEPNPEPTPDPEPTPAPTPIYTCTITSPILRKGDKDTGKGGDKGVTVSMLQMGLKKNGISLGIWGVDGDFGSTTERAVKEFQSNCNLMVDGIVGQDTWQVLFQ